MPCPYFEPVRPARDPRHAGARLPLLDEYEGLCHVSASVPAPTALRFQCCNQGYSRGSCDRFPVDELRSGMRYNITARTAAVLEVLCIEEQQYAPIRWHSVRYVIENGQLEPEPMDACMRAQLLAFCRSYLVRFSH